MAMMSIGRVIQWQAERDPDRPSITHETDTVTRRELDLRTNRLARAYQDLGVEQDDFVTIARADECPTTRVSPPNTSHPLSRCADAADVVGSAICD